MEVNFWQDKGKTQLWWTVLIHLKKKHGGKLSTEPALITAFQYRKLSETTAYEIEKMKPEIYEVRYEDFVKNPKAFIHDLMQKLQLKPSKLVDDYMADVSPSVIPKTAKKERAILPKNKRKKY